MTSGCSLIYSSCLSTKAPTCAMRTALCFRFNLWPLAFITYSMQICSRDCQAVSPQLRRSRVSHRAFLARQLTQPGASPMIALAALITGMIMIMMMTMIMIISIMIISIMIISIMIMMISFLRISIMIIMVQTESHRRQRPDLTHARHLFAMLLLLLDSTLVAVEEAFREGCHDDVVWSFLDDMVGSLHQVSSHCFFCGALQRITPEADRGTNMESTWALTSMMLEALASVGVFRWATAGHASHTSESPSSPKP